MLIAGDPIQNSIDAHDGGDHPNAVELGIHDGDNSSVACDDVDSYFGNELRLHIAAKENDAEVEISKASDLQHSMKIVNTQQSRIFTPGLEGRIDQYDLDPPQGTIYANVVNFINRFMWFSEYRSLYIG